MLTNNWMKILASGIMTGQKVSIDAVGYDGNTSNQFLGYGSGASTGYLISSLMNQVRKEAIKNSNAYGVWFGDGETPPTKDDYTYDGNIITTFTHTATISSEADVNGVSTSALYTITNSGSEEFTIREVCLFSRWYRSSTSDYYGYLIDRTVLDTPVTIPAGGIGQVTYTIRMNYPTA